ncbi:MAG: AAA family ATPase [Betaproteobacteria bacterium]|nr:AAA family ATPase [Betaproteobacteria bacterium]
MEAAVGAISEAMAIYVEEKARAHTDERIFSRMREHFESVYPRAKFHSTGMDGHVVQGLFRRQRGHVSRPEGELPRLVQLIDLHISEAFAQADERRLAEGYVLLPSPLHIAVEALTIPEEPHTRAFPILAGRLLLSQRIGAWPRNSFTEQTTNASLLVDESTIIEEVGNCRTWVEIGDIWSIKADAKKSFVGNFMAMRGVLLMRVDAKTAPDFLRGGLFSHAWKVRPHSEQMTFQFRLSKRYVTLPAPADFMNEVLGVPVALRGFENVFFNGIKPSVGAGLVMQLAGGPGTGKTTFALALAAALAPLGTQTFYFSFEEAQGDLVSKLRQQSQPRLSRLSYHSATDDEWFTAFPIRSASLDAIEENVIEPLRRDILQAKRDWPQRQRAGELIPPLPFLVVLDSLSALSIGAAGEGTTPRQRLAAFVETCREMRVLIVLITSDAREAWGELDYLVDMVIQLRVESADEHTKKPVRLFSLSKSRQQISRHGTHIFHLSGDAGFRVAPQLSSQMDAQQNLRQVLWDRDAFLEVLNVRRRTDGGFKYVEFLRLHSGAQILIQGRGSSGKAGLALRMALAPKYTETGYVVGQRVPRVLVLSFLYPQSYYEVLQQRSQRLIVQESKITSLRGLGAETAERYAKSIPTVSVIHLTPGVLHAEDLHSKMVRKLEEGRLSGRPYTTVIIDGLHNLALQFPGASESNHLFPIIYGTLSRANVMTITTFTTLAINSSEAGFAADATEESIFRLRVHLPLLHTLVQASDYVLELFRADRATREAHRLSREETAGAIYLLKVQSAISRDPPPGFLGWGRQDLEFLDPGWGYDEIQQALPID